MASTWLNSSFFAGTSSLVIASAGAGILAFPWALSAARLPSFLGLSALVLISNATGMTILAAHTEDGAWCYELVVERAFGTLASRMVTASIVLLQFGALSGFLVAIADFAAPLGVPPAPLLAGLAAFILWPLSLVPSLHTLWVTNVISFATLCVVSGVIIARAATRDDPNGQCPAGRSGTEAPLALLAWPPSASLFIESAPIILFGFIGHLQVPIIAHEARRACADAPTARRAMLAAILSALGVCAALYAATALAGVACYGEGISTDVLTNLGDDASSGRDALAAVGGAAMAVHLTFACTFHVLKRSTFLVPILLPWPFRLPLVTDPVLLYPLLVSVNTLLSGSAHPPLTTATNDAGRLIDTPATDDATSTVRGGASLLQAASAAPRVPRTVAAIRGAAIVVLTVTVALLAGHRLSVVFATIGGSVGAALACWFPSALIVSDSLKAYQKGASPSRGMRLFGSLLAALVMSSLGFLAFAGTVMTLTRGPLEDGPPPSPPRAPGVP